MEDVERDICINIVSAIYRAIYKMHVFHIDCGKVFCPVVNLENLQVSERHLLRSYVARARRFWCLTIYTVKLVVHVPPKYTTWIPIIQSMNFSQLLADPR